MITRSDLCGIVTTFSPDKHSVNNIADLARRLDHVIIIDDSGDSEVSKFLQSSIQQLKNVSLFSNDNNKGIAYSLNRGVKQAAQFGYSWNITFDDDTKVVTGAFQRLFDAINARNTGNSNDQNVYCLSRSLHVVPNQLSTSFIEHDVGITSGSLFSVSLHEQVSGFEESYFIDLVDFDYSLKVRTQGGKILLLNAPDMEHVVGIPSTKQLGIKVTVQNHAAFRRYYHFRNAVAFSKTHARNYPLFVLKLWIGMLRILLKIVLFEKNRVNKMKSILIGLNHGFSGVTGRIPSKVFDRTRHI